MSTYTIRLNDKQEGFLRQLAEKRKEKRARTLKWLIEEAARVFLNGAQGEDGEDQNDPGKN